MTVLQVEKIAEEFKLAITSEFSASVDNVWRMWSEAQLFERWWGPPGFSFTSEEHNITPGGRIAFFFTGPEGEKFPMVWEVLEAEPPTHLVLRDADVDEDGTPADGNGVTKIEIGVVAAGDVTRMSVTTHFDSVEGLEHSGFDEGMTMMLENFEAILAEVAASA